MLVKDPVCGMEIDPQTAFASREHMGQTFYFCSPSCVEKFDANLHQYAHPAMNLNDEALAGSLTTGFNPSLPLVRLDLPVVGLKGKNRSAGLALRWSCSCRYRVIYVHHPPHSGCFDPLLGASITCDAVLF